MKVAEIMTARVEFIDPDATVQDAAVLMGELDVSALPIGSREALQGIITDRDILYRLVAEGLDPRQTRLSAISTRRVFTCRPDDPIATALDLMASHNIRRLAVVEAGTVVGWLTLSDLSRHLLVDNGLVKAGLEQIAAEPKSPGQPAREDSPLQG